MSSESQSTVSTREPIDGRRSPPPPLGAGPVTEAQPQRGASAPKSRRATRRVVALWIRRALLAVLAVAAAGAIVYAWLPKPVVVETAVARRGPLEVTVEEEGKTRVRERFVVTAPISGNLWRVEREVGDAIEKGEVLAKISPPDPALLDPRTRDEAQARLAAALAQERAAGTAVVRAVAAAEDAARVNARAHKLAQGGAVPTTEVERAELAEKVSRAELEAARENKLAAAAEVRAARALLGGRSATPAGEGPVPAGGGATSQARGGKARAREPRGVVSVASPASGRILRRVRDSAGPVMQGAPLVEVGEPRALEIVIDVLSTDAAVVAPGMAVEVTGWGGGPLAGTVARVEPAAFTRVSALGVEEQRVNVIVDLPAAPANLGDGFRVEGKIVLWRGEALTVPASAVFRDRGQWAVYTAAGGRAQLVPVDVGKRGRLAVEVTSGLKVGDVVILHPGDQVSQGARVAEKTPGGTPDRLD